MSDIPIAAYFGPTIFRGADGWHNYICPYCGEAHLHFAFALSGNVRTAPCDEDKKYQLAPLPDLEEEVADE